MVIHIALIGRETAHVWPGLKEIIPADKLYLLHSPNTERDKFADKAKKLKKEVEKTFCETVLVKINAFEMMNILEIIDKIVSDEIKKSDYDLDTIDFAVNVTGGTNIMASGATLAAMLTGTKAYYVQDSRIGLKRKKYAEFLPIPPINIIRSLSKSHQKILQTLENGSFEWKGEKQLGVMKNKDLEKKLKMRTSSLNSAVKELVKKRFVETKRGVPVIKYKKGSADQKPVEVEEILENQMLVCITDLGKIQAKKAALRK
ncbi:MAG: HFX_2341 family transcriptional regulator domain-containing protein [Candidatus Nitrosopumilus sp. bin_68KS]